MTTPVVQQLLNRASMPRLDQPAPTADELEQVLRAGLLAPDHAYLRPTRLHQVSGDGLARLGECFAAAVRQDNPQASPAALEKARTRPLRAPLILVAGCRPVAHEKVPVVEQLASTAACVSLMQTALDGLGYASMWRTGAMAYHPHVKAAFGLGQEDHLVAFLYVGTAVGAPKQRSEIPLDQYCFRF